MSKFSEFWDESKASDPVPHFGAQCIPDVPIWPGIIPMGWQCPVCRIVHAPTILCCPNCKPKESE